MTKDRRNDRANSSPDDSTAQKPPARQTSYPDDALIQRIKDGDGEAWQELVVRFTPLLRKIAMNQGLLREDAADAVQLTWLRCLEYIHQLTQAAALVAWLATICRRESVRLAAKRGREELMAGVDDAMVHLPSNWVPDPSEQVVRHEQVERVRRAVAALPVRPRAILEAMIGPREEGYAEMSCRLGIPIGSLGPTRQRALERLREDPLLVALMAP